MTASRILDNHIIADALKRCIKSTDVSIRACDDYYGHPIVRIRSSDKRIEIIIYKLYIDMDYYWTAKVRSGKPDGNGSIWLANSDFELISEINATINQVINEYKATSSVD